MFGRNQKRVSNRQAMFSGGKEYSVSGDRAEEGAFITRQNFDS